MRAIYGCSVLEARYALIRRATTFNQQKRGWTRRSEGAGIHPPSPGTLATAAREGTRGAPSGVSNNARCSTSDCPALLIGNRDTRSSEAIGAVPCDMQAHKGRRAARRYGGAGATLAKSRSHLNLLAEGEKSTQGDCELLTARRARSSPTASGPVARIHGLAVQMATAPQFRSGAANWAGISDTPRNTSTASTARRSIRPSPSVSGSARPGRSTR